MGIEKKPLAPGTRFGMLTVIGKDEKKTKEKKRQYYFCQCDCGSPVKSIAKASLVSKRRPTFSCGCHDKYRQGFIDNRETAVAKVLYGKMKKRHVSKLEDDIQEFITFEDFLIKIHEPCHYCGAVDTSYLSDRATDYVLHYNGLDRLDSSKGYRKDNTVSCCVDCNIAKGTMMVDEFADFLKRIHEFQNKED